MTDTAAFIDFLLDSGVLTFGDFLTKSGRPTPYFINTGNFHFGSQLARLGEFYADAAQDCFSDFNVLFGPAYKGIPLAVTTAVALAGRGQEVAFSSLRKEEKDHGDRGAWLGKVVGPGDKVVIIEDVTTAGTSVRESVPALREAGAEVVGLVVAVDRQERGSTNQTALREVAEMWGIATTSIAGIDEIVASLREQGRLDDATYDRILAHRAEWGPQA